MNKALKQERKEVTEKVEALEALLERKASKIERRQLRLMYVQLAIIKAYEQVLIERLETLEE